MPLNSGNFNTDALRDFDRDQEVTQVYRLSGGELRLVPLFFTETWSGERKKQKAAEILSEKYITYGAFDGDRVIGEIMLIKELNRGRMIVDSLHVSRGYRAPRHRKDADERGQGGSPPAGREGALHVLLQREGNR